MTTETGPPRPAGTKPRRGRPPAPDTEQRVLTAALDLLAREGYAGLTLNVLAARSGLAKTTILRRWGSKAAVAAAAVERLALHSVDLPESGTLRGDLIALQHKAVAVFTDGEGGFIPRLIRESGHPPEIADLLHPVIHTRRLAYHRILGRAIARHELDRRRPGRHHRPAHRPDLDRAAHHPRPDHRRPDRGNRRRDPPRLPAASGHTACLR